MYGSHTFNAAGTYSIGVTVNDKGGQTLAITPIIDNATVVQSSLIVSALPQTSQAGIAIPAGTVIGSFNDVLGADPIGQYTFSVDWGDGTGNDTGLDITSLGGSSFSLSTQGGHTYASAGIYALKLRVNDPPVSGLGGNLVVINGTGASLPSLTPGAPITAVEGNRNSGLVVATFTDSAPGVTTASFSAVIDWGDGSPASAGIISTGVGPGSFVIKGTHAFAEEGSFTVTVWLSDTPGDQVTTSTTATVADAALSSPTGLALMPSEDVPLAQRPAGHLRRRQQRRDAGRLHRHDRLG